MGFIINYSTEVTQLLLLSRDAFTFDDQGFSLAIFDVEAGFAGYKLDGDGLRAA